MYVGERREDCDKSAGAAFRRCSSKSNKAKPNVTMLTNRLDIYLHHLLQSIDYVVRCDLWNAKLKPPSFQEHLDAPRRVGTKMKENWDMPL